MHIIRDLMFEVFIRPVLGCFLRQEEGEANAAAASAKNVAAGYGSSAAGEHAALTPFYAREMHAEHAFDPTQLNEMLTAAGLGAGATAGGLETSMQRQGATSGNAAGQSKNLQELARDRIKANSAGSEAIAGQDVLGAQKLRQEGASGMQGLYGTDVKAQLDAMGQIAGDVNAATNASKTGWLQDAEGVVKTAADVAAPIPGM